MPDDLVATLLRVDGWMSWPSLHLMNNESQWAEVFERPGDPSTEDIKPVRFTGPDEGRKPIPSREGVESPASFWPKFEHRFRPAEELWVEKGLPGCLEVGAPADRARELFEKVLMARDELAAALPPDGQTPRIRAGGLAILDPMRRLLEAMGAFGGHVGRFRRKPRGRRAKRSARAESKTFAEEQQRWLLKGPHEGLNY